MLCSQLVHSVGSVKVDTYGLPVFDSTNQVCCHSVNFMVTDTISLRAGSSMLIDVQCMPHEQCPTNSSSINSPVNCDSYSDRFLSFQNVLDFILHPFEPTTVCSDFHFQ